MKYALVTPVGGLRILERVGLGYHLCLAQELLKNKQYRDYYRALGRLGHHIIVDNGAAERDTPEFSKVVEVSRYVLASEVVMPDRVCDWQGTLDVFNDEALALVPSRKRFIVPQGETIDEWFLCLERMLDKCRYSIETIGLSKYHEKVFLGGRAAVLERLAGEYSVLLEHIHVHILGIATADPFEELRTLHAAYSGIRGVDSAAPVAWAQRLRSLPDLASDGTHISVAWDEPFTPDILQRAQENTFSLALYAAKLRNDHDAAR